MSLRFSTGLLPRRPEARARFDEVGGYCVRASSRRTIVQHFPFVRNQGSKPSCVGQALAACVDYFTGRPPWASALDLWVDARRRQGNLEGILDGTRSEYAIESLIRRGWSSYVPGEDHRSTDQDDQLPSLTRELEATDRRMQGLSHRCVIDDRSHAVIAALEAGCGVLLSAGVRSPYQDPAPNTVLGLDHRGGASNGHCERVLGYDAARRAFIVQGSWGAWTWCEVDGRRLVGCCLVAEEVIEEAWDVDVIIRG